MSDPTDAQDSLERTKSRASHVLEIGVDIRMVQGSLGQGWIESSGAYLQLSDAHLRGTPSPVLGSPACKVVS